MRNDITNLGPISDAIDKLASEKRSSERNDCTVRAIVDAYDVPYEYAHSFCKRFGREDGQGCHIQATMLEKLGLKILTQYINMRVTVALRTVDKDKVYLCLVMGYIFAIRAGVPCETKDLSGWLLSFGAKKVIRMFEVPLLNLKVKE